MRYLNKKTGVVIDTPCIISGGDWEECADVETEDKTQANSKAPEKPESDDTLELSKMTVNSLKKLAAEHNIDLGNATKKDDIIKVIMESDAFEVE